MILRLGSLLLILYGLGFALFGVTIGEPAAGNDDDAVGRFGAGADPSVTKADLVHRLGGRKRLVQCCVDLGSESVDTRSNAEETRRWLERQRFRSVRLITSDWHMRRARYEFRRELRQDYQVVPDAVRSEPGFMTLFGEYNKYLLRRVAVWLDI